MQLEIIYECIYVQVKVLCPKLCTQSDPYLKGEIKAILKMLCLEQNYCIVSFSGHGLYHNHRRIFLSNP